MSLIAALALTLDCSVSVVWSSTVCGGIVGVSCIACVLAVGLFFPIFLQCSYTVLFVAY